jgi:tetratricopeptide (TPR) repeat protein
MKTYSRLLIILVIFASALTAQVDLPKLSPRSIVSQEIGYTTITIDYGRPSVHGRKIWGDLVPYNKVWRTGANEATTIQFNTDVLLEGKTVQAGRYSFFTIPTEKNFTIILNKVDKQWGAFNYNQKEDYLRIEVKPHKSDFVESMLFYFSEINQSSVKLNFAWEHLSFTCKIEVDVLSQAYGKIKEALANAKSDDWQIYSASANFAADNNVYIDEALQWAEKGILINQNYYSFFVKAKLLYKKGIYIEALKTIDKSRDAGRNDKNYEFFVAQIDILEREIKSKL